MSKYFKFDTNGPTIGSGENSLKLVLDNKEIGFFKNNQKIAWWDGNYLHTGNIEVTTNELCLQSCRALCPEYANWAHISYARHRGGLSL